MRALAFILATLGWLGQAQAFSEADRSAVQAVIEQQLEAFARDDAAAAYSHAAPGIKQMFPSQDIFMELVRKAYQPVYRQRSHGFGALEPNGTKVNQTVELIDAEGTEWTALYTLEMQPDGSWKITSCVLVKKPGLAV